MANPKIMVVDDDRTISLSLERAFSKAGYEVTLMQKATDAAIQLKMHDYKAVIVDCLLPGMNGIDFAIKIHEEDLTAAPVYLISGIYRDRRFIREAMKKTNATKFFTKPFDVQQLVDEFAIDVDDDDGMDMARPPLHKLLSKDDATVRDVIKAVESTDNLQGFDLPLVYSLLVNAEATGFLNVVEAGGDLFGITFYNGKIIKIDTNHSKSYLGNLLVEKGFINRELVDKALSQPSRKKLGERLVQENYLSPHAIDEVMADQLAIRLSKTIFDTSVEINFNESNDISDAAGIKLDGFNTLLHDWIISKIPVSWLINFYMGWMEQVVVKGPKYNLLPEVSQTPLFSRIPGFDKELITNKTLFKISSNRNYKDQDIFMAIHLLATRQIICFGTRSEQKDYVSKKQRLLRLEKELEGKNFFEILSVSKRARNDEIKRAYHELAKVFHPDKLDSDAPTDLAELNKKVFSSISAAHNMLKDERSRKQYLGELEQGRADELLKGEAIFEKGKNLLKTGQADKAYELFEEASQFNLRKSEITLHLIWAQIKRGDLKKGGAVIKEFESRLNKIPPEDRHEAIYHFVRGLFAKAVKEPEMAKSLFDKAIAIDPSFLDARRELNLLKLRHENNTKTVNILSGDLKDVVGMLFKRKKK